MPTVYNKHHKNAPKDAVYIGRGSKWGNPFSHMEGTKAQFVVKDRDEAVEHYEQWLLNQPLLVQQAQEELKGKDVVCFCAPKRCHGDVLVKVANMDLTTNPSAPTQPQKPVPTLKWKRG